MVDRASAYSHQELANSCLRRATRSTWNTLVLELILTQHANGSWTKAQVLAAVGMPERQPTPAQGTGRGHANQNGEWQLKGLAKLMGTTL